MEGVTMVAGQRRKKESDRRIGEKNRLAKKKGSEAEVSAKSA